MRDCETLLAARAALFVGKLVNWGSGSPLDQWEGVTVAGTPLRVTGLDLHDVRLGGSVPPVLGALDHLQVLNLSLAYVSGPIPPALGQLRKLESLVLHSNQLTGGVPVELGQLRNLAELRLDGNQLTGRISAGLRRVKNNDLAKLGLPDCEAGA